MAGSVQDALADVAVRLESLKAALGDKQAAADRDADQLAAIQRMAEELQSLLHQQPQQDAQGEMLREQGPHVAAPAVQAEPAAPTVAPQLPSTPFEQRRAPGPAAGPATAAKPPAPTPGGLPATTPLAAEVLASLNAAAGASGSANPPAAARAADDADDAAAATLSGMLGGLDPRGSGASICGLPPARTQQQQQQPSLASLLQGVSLAPPMPAHSAAAAAAAAAAAGSAMPAPRRASGSAAPQLLPFAAAPAKEQRPCNCKRSMCLKMYCECFAAGGFCAPTCSCANCSNSPAHLGAVMAAREVVLAKNPRAFEVKVTATEGHKRGCRCKRSKCLKKYCECFHAGARCNPDVCQCEDCRNTDGDAMPLPVLSKRVSAAAAAMAAAAQQMPTWVDTSADVLAMFQQQPLLPLPAGDASGGSNSSGSSGRRGRARSQALQLPLLPSGGFSFAGLPPMPEPAGPGSFNPAAAAAAAAALGGLPPAGLFAPLAPAPTAFNPAAAAAFMMNPVAAAAATIAAAASLVEQQQQRQAQLEESMADAVSCPAAEPAATAPSAAAQPPAVAAATPGAFKMASALTSHLSDVVCATDSEMHDTATSPAPHMAIAKLVARRTLLAGANAATLTGGAAGPMRRPPLAPSRVRSRAPSGDDSQLSQGSADENAGDSLNTAGSQRSKRPRRAASGGVLGAVAAEASEWGLDIVSPPLKRANSLPVALEKEGKAGGRGKAVSDRVALLKKALAGETAVVARELLDAADGACGAAAASDAPTADDEDAISALFELSSSVC